MSQTQVETAPREVITLSSQLQPYEHPKETSEKLEYADLSVLDFSLWDQPGGKDQLARTLDKAIQEVGFFYVTNFGLSQKEVDDMLALARDIFSLPLEEKNKVYANLAGGEGYAGYRGVGERELAPGVFANTELYSFNKFIPELKRNQVPFVEEHIQEIEAYSRHMHEVGSKLLVLMAKILQLPENFFADQHRYETPSGDSLRFMKYGKMPKEKIEKLGDAPLIRGHTDFGSITMLQQQPVVGLQVQTPSGAWKHVRPHPGSITVNIADCLDFVSGGYLKSSIHRVCVPPPDQQHYDRIGLVYFMRPGDQMSLDVVNSPVIRGRSSRLGDAHGLTAGEWVKARTKNNAKVTLAEFDKPLIVNGVEVKKFE